MTSTHQKVRYSPERKVDAYTRETAAEGVEHALKLLEGRWKLVILFHLFGGRVMRFSDLERAIPLISQKMLIQRKRDFPCALTAVAPLNRPRIGSDIRLY